MYSTANKAPEEALQGQTLRQQQKAQTRAHLLSVARAEFAKNGYEATSVAQIATAADIAKGALYGHFENKEALFRAIQLDYIQQRSTATAARIRPEMSLYEGLTAITQSAWDIHHEGSICSVLSTEFFALAGRSDWGRDATSQIFRHCASALVDFLNYAKKRGDVRSDLNSLTAARLMLALHDGLVLQWQCQPTEIDPKDYIAPMADMIFAYVSDKDTSK
jgi:AcrR family transcriptional regulator